MRVIPVLPGIQNILFKVNTVEQKRWEIFLNNVRHMKDTFENIIAAVHTFE